MTGGSSWILVMHAKRIAPPLGMDFHTKAFSSKIGGTQTALAGRPGGLGIALECYVVELVLEFKSHTQVYSTPLGVDFIRRPFPPKPGEHKQP